MNIHIKSITAALAFSLLFYSQSFGLNIFLISILVVVLLTTIKKKRPTPWVYAIAYLFTAAMVFVNPSAFHLFVHFISLIFLIGKSIAIKTPLYLSGLTGLINLLAASLINISEQKKNPGKKKIKFSRKTNAYLKGGLITVVLVLLFVLLYRNANPVFENLISQIDFSFISVPWIVFTLMGYMLFLHILRPYHPTELLELDKEHGNELQEPTESFSLTKLYKLDSERTIGSIVFSTLNLLLIGFLITDVIYLLEPDILSNADYSKSVHKGVYALMFSIVCAIGIILYFFRGDLNFYKGNKRLKNLVFIWIGLNIFLISFTFYKNWNYVEALGFTYKRIGVFVYLLLVLIGLATTYIKVFQTKSFMYLLRTNTAIIFCFLILSSAISWDKAITTYNLTYIQNPDMEYLLDLGNSNAPLLYNYGKDHKKSLFPDFKIRIANKYFDFQETQSDRTWQEYTMYQISHKNENQ